MIRVLFVSSGNIGGGKPTNLIYAQGESLQSKEIHVDYYTIVGKGVIGYLKNVKLLKRKLKEGHYEIIHAHYGFCGIVAYLAKSRQKVIVSLMGSDLLDYDGSNYAKQWLNRIVIFTTKLFSRFFLDFTIVKSKVLQEALFQNTKSSIIPNGVNLKTFYPIGMIEARRHLGLDLNKKIILFSTDPARQEKNYELAKDAFEKLKLENKELKVVHGVSQSDLNLYYNASDVVLLTSFFEGSPNVIKEALACNRPIVSTNVGDVNDNLNSVSGCYVTGFDANDVVDKLKKALTYKTSNGRDKISHLDSEVIAQKISMIYKTLLK